MSKLKKLLEGVEIEWETIDDYINYIQPTKYLVKSKNYSNEYTTPVLTAGKTFVLGYTDEIDGIYKGSITPVIIFDDFTTANKWVDFDFKAKSSAMKILVAKDYNKISLKYFFYILKTIPSDLVDGDHKRQWISNYANKLIPIPCPDNPEKSLKIQQEIVRILDRLSEETNQLNAALQKELQIHQKRYNFYREELLRFEGKEVEWKSLGEVYKFQYGKGNTIPTNGGEYPVYGSNGIVGTHTDYNSEDAPVIGHIGAYAGIVNWASGKHFVTYNGVICKLITGDVIPRYGYYQLLKQDFNSLSKNSSQPFVSYKELNSVIIPIPTVEIQQEIVRVLDSLTEEINQLTKALQKEISLRNKLYEFYRDRLLSFPK